MGRSVGRFNDRRCAFDFGAADDTRRKLVQPTVRAFAGRVIAVPRKPHQAWRLLAQIEPLHKFSGAVGNVDLHVTGTRFEFYAAFDRRVIFKAGDIRDRQY